MTLQQLARVKRWQVQHRRDHPLEFHAWDAVLTAWLIGWVGLPAAALLGTSVGALTCVVALNAPGLYLSLRRRLHRAARLRCDWLASLSETPRGP